MARTALSDHHRQLPVHFRSRYRTDDKPRAGTLLRGAVAQQFEQAAPGFGVQPLTRHCDRRPPGPLLREVNEPIGCRASPQPSDPLAELFSLVRPLCQRHQPLKVAVSRTRQQHLPRMPSRRVAVEPEHQHGIGGRTSRIDHQLHDTAPVGQVTVFGDVRKHRLLACGRQPVHGRDQLSPLQRIVTFDRIQPAKNRFHRTVRIV